MSPEVEVALTQCLSILTSLPNGNLSSDQIQRTITLEIVFSDLQATAGNTDDPPWNCSTSVSFFKPALSQLSIYSSNSS